MAGAGYKLFNSGDVLTAAQVNEFLMQQTCMVFADAAARTTALSGVVAEGMISYLKDTNAVEVYNGSAWVASDDPNAIQNTIVDAKGDLISATAADTPARLASSGVNGDVLTVDTSTATGLKWAAPAGGSSPLTTKGDIYTYSTTDARLGVGANGETLIANSGATTGLSWQPLAVSNRNFIINGAMLVNQRGTSVAGENFGALDRWATTVGGGLGAFTQSVETDGPTGSGLTKSYKLNFTTADAAPAAADQLQVQYRMEGQNLQRIKKGTSAAEQLTLSFWVKSNVTGTYIAELFDVDNTRFVSASYTISASATWEKKTITFPADTTGALDNDSNRSLDVRFWLGAGTNFTSGTLGTTWHTTTANRAVGQTNAAAAINNYWQITGAQLETGAIATAFDFRSIQEELAACQRYYYRLTPGAAGRYFGNGQCISITNSLIITPFPVEMRTAPTALEQSGTAANYKTYRAGSTSDALTAVPTFESATTRMATTATVSANLVAGNCTNLLADATGAYLGWSAEL